MMISSSFIFLQLAIVVLFMVTCTATTKVPQSIEEASESYHDEQHPTSVLTDHQQTVDDSKQVVLNDDEDLSTSNSDEEYNNDDHRHRHNQAIWPELVSKRYSEKTMNHAGNSAVSGGGDSRLWAIPYRFGKRAAMPYRFGKRAAAMHFRLGKKSASL